MKLEKIFCFLLMLIITISILGIVIGVNIHLVLSTNSLKKIADKSLYIENIEEKVLIKFNEYLSSEESNALYDTIDTKTNIIKLIGCLEENNAEEVQKKITEDVNIKVIYVLDKYNLADDITAKEAFANKLSNEYLKLIFPTTGYSKICNIYSKYFNKIYIIVGILSLVIIISFIYLFKKHESFSYFLIGMYNCIIFLTIICFSINIFSNIYITNAILTNFVLNIISTFQTGIICELITIFITAVILTIIWCKKTDKNIHFRIGTKQ